MARYEWPCPKCGQKQTAQVTSADRTGKEHSLCASCQEAAGRKEAGR